MFEERGQLEISTGQEEEGGQVSWSEVRVGRLCDSYSKAVSFLLKVIKMKLTTTHH